MAVAAAAASSTPATPLPLPALCAWAELAGSRCYGCSSCLAAPVLKMTPVPFVASMGVAGRPTSTHTLVDCSAEVLSGIAGVPAGPLDSPQVPAQHSPLPLSPYIRALLPVL